MKNLIAIGISLFFFFNLSGQSKDKLSLEVNYGNSNLMTFEPLCGAPSYDGDGTYAFGLGYNHILNKSFSLKSGLSYGVHNLLITPNFYPDIDLTPKPASLELVSINIGIQFNFFKYFFIGLNEITAFETKRTENISVSKQNGLGLGIYTGFGITFDKIHINLTPYINMNTLIPFKKDSYQYRLMQSGINLGVGYVF